MKRHFRIRKTSVLCVELRGPFISNKLHQFPSGNIRKFYQEFHVLRSNDRVDPSRSLNGTSAAVPNFYNYGIWPEISMGINLKIDEKAGALTSDSYALKRHGKMPARHERGTTLVEVAVAGALLVLAFASLYALYGTTVKEAKGGDTAAIAEQNCSARIDQIRNLNWYNTTNPSTTTDPSNIAGLLYNSTSSDNASAISREVISIYPAAVPPFPAPTPSPSPTPNSTPFFSVTKIGTETALISPSTPPTIVGEKLIRVEVTTEWVTSGTTHQRQLSTLISKSGTKTR